MLKYYEAHDKHVKSPEFPVVLMLLDAHPAPGLPFLRQLHWIVSADPTSEKDVARLIDAAAGTGARPGELWDRPHTHHCHPGAAQPGTDIIDYRGYRGKNAPEMSQHLTKTPQLWSRQMLSVRFKTS
jgi:hypothetical protein